LERSSGGQWARKITLPQHQQPVREETSRERIGAAAGSTGGGVTMAEREKKKKKRKREKRKFCGQRGAERA
jgi:hypothetical protein